MKTCSLKPLFLIISVLTLAFSCTEKRADHSRSLDAYRQAGMPDPGKKWNMEDYTQAHNVLARIKWEYPLELPVKDSEKSGLLLDHMVSLDYLSFLRDTSLTLNEKAERISEFVRVYDYWVDVYTIPMLKENPYQRELVDLRIFNLRLMEEMVKLMLEINQSDDPADAGLKYGYKYIIGNYLSTVHTDLKTQHKAPDFLEEDLERMADSISASVMRNKEWMDSRTLRDLNQSLQSVVDSTSSQYIRNKYSKLKEVLSSAVVTASQ